ncbi:MAG TPA: SPOR domain-containing protein, partial [Caulobacteraceae bacterium]|nr:SPOR domain-containing protein [Caulobacteraceae bacterium]
MSDQERGAYSPQNDAPLAFDARQSRSGGGGFPTTLAISLVILVVLIVAIVLFYRSGVRSSGPGPAPVGTPVAQIKAPAPASGPPSDEAAGLQIYKTEGAPAPTPAAPTFAPPPEQPQPRPTVAAQSAPAAPAPAKPVQAASKDEIGDLIEDSEKPAKPKPA